MILIQDSPGLKNKERKKESIPTCLHASLHAERQKASLHAYIPTCFCRESIPTEKQNDYMDNRSYLQSSACFIKLPQYQDTGSQIPPDAVSLDG